MRVERISDRAGQEYCDHTRNIAAESIETACREAHLAKHNWRKFA